MPARLQSLALVGLGAQPVTVEVDIGAGLPSFTIVGLADKAVGEARERVRAAIKNSGFQFPVHRITVNLAPADLPKIGPAFDLAIALGILIESGVVSAEALNSTHIVGELSLAGDIRPIDGILPMTLSLKKDGRSTTLILPEENLTEAQLVSEMHVWPAAHLRTLVDDLTHGRSAAQLTEPFQADESLPSTDQMADLAHVQGLEQVKRVLEIAAAGNHNLLLIGPPGTGKTLLARAFASILPDLSADEHLETLMIRSAAGLLEPAELTHRHRPVRSPHHTASPVALVGGGTKLRPGEVSLAHRGVLFLDEFPEFPRMVLEALREPLEEGKITIARAQGAMTFPARFTLIAAANPCPCGYFGDPEKACQCGAADLQRYQRKLSGPLLDRIDLVVTVPRQQTKTLLDDNQGTDSATIRQRVVAARSQQARRLDGLSAQTNGDLTAAELKKMIVLSPEARTLLEEAGNRLHLSGRALHRLLKVARTIADLAGAEQVEQLHLAEALQYRPVDALGAH